MTLQEIFKSKYTYVDGQLVSRHTGKPITNKVNGYVSCEIHEDNKITRYRIHRVIYCMHHGRMPNIVDHINGDILDNRIENLRECTLQQNSFNRAPASRNKLGVKGVTYDARTKRYVAWMKINGKSTRIGGFMTLEEAARAYQNKAEELHGSYAFHNR